MHVVKKYQTAVTLFSREGACQVFRSLSAAVKALGYRWICERVGSDFRVATGDPLWPWKHYQYVMRDDFGSSLTGCDFWEYRPVYRSRRQRELDLWNGEGPVPNTGRRRGGHFFRRMRTHNERKLNQVLDEFEVPPRAARSSLNLPSSWWDLPVAAREERSWKRHRKTRWKEKRSTEHR